MGAELSYLHLSVSPFYNITEILHFFLKFNINLLSMYLFAQLGNEQQATSNFPFTTLPQFPLNLPFVGGKKTKLNFIMK